MCPKILQLFSLYYAAQAVLSYGGAPGKDECQGPPTSSFQELQNKKKFNILALLVLKIWIFIGDKLCFVMVEIKMYIF